MLGLFTKNTTRVLSSHLSVATYATKASKKVAVVLSGCGVFDGSEIHEASYVLAHLTREGVEPLCFAPDIPQLHVINHHKGAPVEKECRNVLTESARIARGNVKPLNLLNESCADAIVFPGGFGAAKNLSDFALKGADCSVNEDVARVLKEFHKARKPIGLCCIAPVLAAKILGNVVLTLGKKDGECWPHSGAIEQAEKMGAKMEFKNVDEIAVDTKNNIITTPAFMFDGKFHEIYDGIGLMIKELVCQIKNSTSIHTCTSYE
ncbi:hypothetical protein R5R35_006815 [Gryllus longicercus]|uniref:ES1 protein n=1 Tax=Gryllus longicercus TaxID=2509291 RepID=A0AAN9VL66_9ORTH